MVTWLRTAHSEASPVDILMCLLASPKSRKYFGQVKKEADVVWTDAI